MKILKENFDYGIPIFGGFVYLLLGNKFEKDHRSRLSSGVRDRGGNMRLFIAINFMDEVKSQVKEIINKVRVNSIQGKFVNEEHMHLTVEFLGEISNTRVDLIKNVLDELEYEPFTLKLNEIGYFKRREGNIYWLGIERHDSLLHIHHELHQKLINQGFELEDREYKPHLTIGRKVKLKDGFNPKALNKTIGEIEIYVDKVDLMKSEHIDGKLIHTVL